VTENSLCRLGWKTTLFLRSETALAIVSEVVAIILGTSLISPSESTTCLVLPNQLHSLRQVRAAGIQAIEGERLVKWYFVFFLISGFCSVLYELVWLRLSMAQFGVTTAMVSIVLSVFMAGLGLGFWASGRWLCKTESAGGSDVLRLYALIELLIGVSGIVVASELLWGRRVLEHYSFSSSVGYYSIAGLWIAVTVIPWCSLMGATVPVGMRAIGQTLPSEADRSFSYLYMANVGGAVAGTTVPLFLIELLGFRGTLRIGAGCNCLIAISALALSRKSPKKTSVQPAQRVA